MLHLEKIEKESERNNNKITMEFLESLNLNDDEFEEVINFLNISEINLINDVDSIENYDMLEFELLNNETMENSIKIYLKDILKKRLLTAEEERQLFDQYKKGKETAREKLIESNLRLVITTACKFSKNTSIDILDLIQEGNIGLIKAIDKFDLSKGCKLSTYATWWIRQRISRTIADKGRSIRIPVHLYELNMRIKRFIYEFYIKNGREPNLKEISSQFNITQEYADFCLQNMDEVLSLNMTKPDEDDRTLEDFIADEGCFEEDVCRTVLVEEICSIIGEELPKRDYFIIMARAGFVGGRPWTLEEIGKKLNITRARVKQKEVEILKKIRTILKRRGYEIKDKACLKL